MPFEHNKNGSTFIRSSRSASRKQEEQRGRNGSRSQRSRNRQIILPEDLRRSRRSTNFTNKSQKSINKSPKHDASYLTQRSRISQKSRASRRSQLSKRSGMSVSKSNYKRRGSTTDVSHILEQNERLSLKIKQIKGINTGLKEEM